MKILHDSKHKVINFLDERFYTEDGVEYFPSVTTILDVYPKGYGFNQWLKTVGFNAEEVVKKAADQGSRIHDAIDRYINGEKLTWADPDGSPNYVIEEWLMILKFVEFWQRYKPEVIANEVSMLDKTLGWGGTLDLVCKFNNEIWLIDYKSSNMIHTTHELQINGGYRPLWNKKFPDKKIQRAGILHLKAQTRGEGKNGVIQGKGWILKEWERPPQQAYSLFLHTKAIWDEENPNYVPKNEQYPDFLELEKEIPQSIKSSPKGEIK